MNTAVRVRAIGMALLAPLIAVVVAVLATTVVIAAAGSSPGDFFTAMFSNPLPRIRVNIVNQSALIYISAVAAAIGFRMGLFNIGIEGQYTIASFAAATFAGAAFVGGFLNVALALVVAMVVGAAWAGIAGILKTTRGVSEVISTIMLNAIAITLVGYLLNRYGVHEGNTVRSEKIPESSRLTGYAPYEPRDGQVWLLVLLAVALGVGFWVLLTKTRFGYDLRASGQSETAARASGINPKRMVVISMLLSGAVAGLVGISQLLGFFGRYTQDFPSGFGFTGIGVALLGRNHPVGMAIGALLFSFLSSSARILDLEDVPKEIVDNMQAVILLSVVVAHEVVRRMVAAAEVRAAAEHEAVAA